MKIHCHCGEMILDIVDGQSNKAHFIPDQEWEGLWDAIDAAVEKSGPSPKDKERACMELRSLLGQLARLAWQCDDCGRIYLEQQNRQLRQFLPGSEDTPKELFRSRPSK